MPRDFASAIRARTSSIASRSRAATEVDCSATVRVALAALAILEDVQTYLATPGKWCAGAWLDHGKRHCLIGAVRLFGRRRNLPGGDICAAAVFLARALRREGAATDCPETFNDRCNGPYLVLELVAPAIEIVRAELDGKPVPTAPRCPAIAAFDDLDPELQIALLASGIVRGREPLALPELRTEADAAEY